MKKLVRAMLVAACALAATLAIAPAAFATDIYLNDYGNVTVECPSIPTEPELYYLDTVFTNWEPDIVVNGKTVSKYDTDGTLLYSCYYGGTRVSNGQLQRELVVYGSNKTGASGKAYCGMISLYVPIMKSPLSAFDSISLTRTTIDSGSFAPKVTGTVSFDGKTKKPEITDYCTLKYYTTEAKAKSNTDGKTSVTKSGTYWVRITGKTGGPLKGYVIKQVKLQKTLHVYLSKTDYMYDGSYHKPKVSVEYNGKKLTEGTSYAVTSIKSHKASGTYTVTVKGKGNYVGKTYYIKWHIWPKKTYGSSTATWSKELTVGKDLPAGIYRFKATTGKIGKATVHDSVYDAGDDQFGGTAGSLSFGKLYYTFLGSGDKIKTCNATFTRSTIAKYSLKSTVYTTKQPAMYRMGKDLKTGTYRLTGANSSVKGTYKVVRTLGTLDESDGEWDDSVTLDPFTCYDIVKSGSLGYGVNKSITLKSGQYLIVQNVKGKKL